MSLTGGGDSFHESGGNKTGLFGKHAIVHPDAVADIEMQHKAAKIEEGNVLEDDTGERTPRGVFAKALEYIRTSSKSRFKKAKRNFEEEDRRINDLDDVLLYAASEDLTFVENMSKSALLEALIRREAWNTRPCTMAGIVFAQVLLCVAAMLSFNEPVNSSTTAMTIIFLITTASSNPFDVFHDLIKLIKKRGSQAIKRIGRTATIAIIAMLSPIWFPLIFVVLVFVFVFDLMVGRIEDNTIGGLANIMVNTIVISTALSVGIRSGSPINAIQTFAGFEFISQMDEALMQQMKFDPYKDYYIPTRPEAKLKKAYVRAVLYVFVPSVTIFSAYITFSNVCLTFCTNNDVISEKLY